MKILEACTILIFGNFVMFYQLYGSYMQGTLMTYTY